MGTLEPPQGGRRVDLALASSKVSAPAIVMIVLAALSILTDLAQLAFRLLGTSIMGLSGASAFGGGGQERLIALLTGGLGLVLAIIGIFVNALIIFGALAMKDLRSYNMAMAAAILNIVPCFSCCCLISMPIGIWALVVLLDSNVKEAFSS